jgi:hypothetical protein
MGTRLVRSLSRCIQELFICICAVYCGAPSFQSVCAHVLVIARVCALHGYYICGEQIWECVGVFGSRVHQGKECVGDRWLFSRTLCFYASIPWASIKTAPRANGEKLFNCRFFLINRSLTTLNANQHALERKFSCSRKGQNGKSIVLSFDWMLSSCTSLCTSTQIAPPIENSQSLFFFNICPKKTFEHCYFCADFSRWWFVFFNCRQVESTICIICLTNLNHWLPTPIGSNFECMVNIKENKTLSNYYSIYDK